MLVLTRKNQESIVVCEPGGFDPVLTVTVLEINRGKVKLGFEVNADIPVHRLEVWDRIRAASGRAGGPAGDAASPTA